MARCAVEVGLDAAELIGAQSEKALQQRVFLGMIRGATEDGLFGVPLLVWGGERFWGNDRIEGSFGTWPRPAAAGCRI